MTSLEHIVDALGRPNVVAFLRVIRARESSQDDSAYRVINGGSHFDAPPWRHPWHGITTGNGARASGAYQFLGTTWSRLCEMYGFPDFSPPNQDRGAVVLIAGRGALDDVLAGRFDAAVRKCRPEWTSLPGAAESTSSWTMDRARDVFLQYGGTLEAAPATPPAPATTNGGPMGGLGLSLVQALIAGFAPLAQEKINGALAKHGVDSAVGQQLVTGVLNAVRPGLAAAPPAQQIAAVAEAQKSPEVVKKAEQTALDLLSTLAPLLDKSVAYDQAKWTAETTGRDAAAARAKGEPWDMTKALVYFAGITSTLVVLALTAAVIWQALQGKDINTALIGLAGPLLMAALQSWREIFAYRFDGTKNSSEQTRALLAVATQPKE